MFTSTRSQCVVLTNLLNSCTSRLTSIKLILHVFFILCLVSFKVQEYYVSFILHICKWSLSELQEFFRGVDVISKVLVWYNVPNTKVLIAQQVILRSNSTTLLQSVLIFLATVPILVKNLLLKLLWGWTECILVHKKKKRKKFPVYGSCVFLS